MAKEEDTVTVGQDLAILELGGEPSGGNKEKAKEDPKEQETSSQPEGGQEQPKSREDKPQPPKEEYQPESPKQESKPQPPPQKKSEAPKEAPKEAEQPKKIEGAVGSREERRVRCSFD